ncbi:MAG: transglycosylase SLT domain-containing protein [Proteobacteria bacterium]|nr:transglycosylase SLT domain-containing protein [Pseudomonadota bacterium]
MRSPPTLVAMKRRLVALAGFVLATAALAAPAPAVRAQGLPDASAAPAAGAPDIDGGPLVLQARDAYRLRDRVRLASLRAAAAAAHHPLAMWVEYWELNNRLADAQQGELDAFAARWHGTYVEDRLRNDWLLELGKRRDWVNFRAEHPRFRMNDDREVACYALVARHAAGEDVREAAKAAWYAQRDGDDGCQLLGQTMVDARRFTRDDVWHELRLAVEANRPRAARAAAALLGAGEAARIDAVFKNPASLLPPWRDAQTRSAQQFAVLALWRLAAADTDAAAARLEQSLASELPRRDLADAWAGVARQAALRLQPRAGAYAANAWRAWERAGKAGDAPPWSDETLGWLVRAALRDSGNARWSVVQRSIDAMSAAEQGDAAWQYWRARALEAQAPGGPEGDGARALARLTLQSIASPLTFYGLLAQENLGARAPLPAAPVQASADEREAIRSHAGLARSLQLIALGLRSEGVREWNFSLRGLRERELLAAAQWACEREVWDRCINTSDRTKTEVDLAQRYPTPFRKQMLAKASEVGIDPALVYGLIRQESRFLLDARSAVGASGLMQLMPATARWTAKKLGIEWRPELITDRDVNLRLGMSYLKLLLDDFGGSAVLAAAGYNAGPGRPRRWREGGTFEPAAWIEAIPFAETRNYVKNVIANSLVYASVLGGKELPALEPRLGATIGPRDPKSPASDANLP